MSFFSYPKYVLMFTLYTPLPVYRVGKAQTNDVDYITPARNPIFRLHNRINCQYDMTIQQHHKVPLFQSPLMKYEGVSSEGSQYTAVQYYISCVLIFTCVLLIYH